MLLSNILITTYLDTFLATVMGYGHRYRIFSVLRLLISAMIFVMKHC